jgi:hypothetical protein
MIKTLAFTQIVILGKGMLVYVFSCITAKVDAIQAGMESKGWEPAGVTYPRLPLD